ncbi:MAG: GNAT family N-acetyltransferase [Cyclobacteriaceae bacterium]|nr:GNAT family N-acetyltransferase [Cyclobacteriaceae bacterium HetDA_MAG_MS6]
MDIIQANIRNLTNLWSSICALHGTYQASRDFDLCFVKEAAWPRRLWFHGMPTITHLEEALRQSPSGMTITTWDAINGSEDQLLQDYGFTLKTEQTGMSLEMEGYIPNETGLALLKVNHESDAKDWASLFQSAFRYQINHELLLKKPLGLDIYIALHEGEPAGTAMLFQDTDKIMGLHSMGIIPAMQRKGLGEKLLLTLLKRAKVAGAEHVTLQASMAGMRLYEKHGFVRQFSMKNYVHSEEER